MGRETLWMSAAWLGVAAWSLGACSTTPLGATETGVSTAKQRAPQGAAVFERECASCHGRRGEGLGAAPNIIGGGALPVYARDPSTTTSTSTITAYAENQMQDQARTRAQPTRPPFKTAQDLFAYVSSAMPLPPSRRGSLEPEEYWAAVNFILIAHGVSVPPAGVTPENAASIRLAR